MHRSYLSVHKEASRISVATKRQIRIHTEDPVAVKELQLDYVPLKQNHVTGTPKYLEKWLFWLFTASGPLVYPLWGLGLYYVLPKH